MNDPFVGQFPCWSDAFKRILNGVAIAAADLDRQPVMPTEVRGVYYQPPAREAPKPRNYYAVFCTHHVPFYRPCSKCNRSARDAQRQISVILGSLKR